MPALAQPCLKYEPAVEKLTGVIERRKAADLNLNENHDPKGVWNTYYAIHLARPICMYSDSETLAYFGWNDTISNVSEIELVNLSPFNQFIQWKKLARSRKEVIVTGKLNHAFNGNQYTDVLIQVEQPIEVKY
ncbi:MAG TPA: hypothetical protein VGM92_09565 [Candidatus Kapabacteria bacterium]|jgi:hypothetical protein